MTPLTPQPTDLYSRYILASGYVNTPLPLSAYTSTPLPAPYVSGSQSYPPSMMDILQHFQDENQKLQLEMRNMRHHIDSRGLFSTPISLNTAPLQRPQVIPRYYAKQAKEPPPPTPVRPITPYQVREHYHPSPAVRHTQDDEWPLPPPPVTLQETPQVQPLPPPHPPGLMEELRERLQRLEACLSPAPSVTSEAHQYDNVARGPLHYIAQRGFTEVQNLPSPSSREMTPGSLPG
ncbi:uncharacterized protein LOC130928562 [Corythoichthys intestinalis]|uniref:uncharacterized protein LOC130928562 n=1 Tax=Corythoichthys intestinalis TaxID=161448 RepID=UPI0025A54472|nr:uncharacterized protein LOC130928562 [Corythoichthys intestinalis]